MAVLELLPCGNIGWTQVESIDIEYRPVFFKIMGDMKMEEN